MRQLSDKDLDALKRFEQLPDCAAVPLNIAALVTGISGRTWRRSPPIPTFKVSATKLAANVGQLRRLAKGELATMPATRGAS
jgi:hypothetical protein